jgi:diguanylate cyclase (GGDEF)-like protein
VAGEFLACSLSSCHDPFLFTGMDKAHAIKYAERLRHLVGLSEFKTDKGQTVKITMSGGIVMIEDAPSKEPSDFVKAADCALYRSKDSGRDKLSVFDRNVDKIAA